MQEAFQSDDYNQMNDEGKEIYRRSLLKMAAISARQIGVIELDTIEGLDVSEDCNFVLLWEPGKDETTLVSCYGKIERFDQYLRDTYKID